MTHWRERQSEPVSDWTVILLVLGIGVGTVLLAWVTG